MKVIFFNSLSSLFTVNYLIYLILIANSLILYLPFILILFFKTNFTFSFMKLSLNLKTSHLNLEE
jgi:hypothetical protein